MAAQKISPIRSSTQDFIEIEDIRDDLVLNTDGSVALVIETSAVNFGLLSEDEQDAIVYAYASFLNSLSFPIQILIMSRKMNISSYLDLLTREKEKQQAPKLKVQISKYYDFIVSLVKENRVLEKKFYIVIPFSPLELGVKSAFPLFPGNKKRQLPFPKEYILERAKTALFPKRDHILRQMTRTGIRGQQLTTQQLIELFYSLYNPFQAESQKNIDSEGIAAPMVNSNL